MKRFQLFFLIFQTFSIFCVSANLNISSFFNRFEEKRDHIIMIPQRILSQKTVNYFYRRLRFYERILMGEIP
jgi:hypothetical protein